jgi:hypothetical protein
MKTIDGIEAVFEHDGGRYVVEYSLIYDLAEFYVDVVRVECFGPNTALTLPVLKQALNIAYEDGKAEWVSMIHDIEALEG